LQIERERSSRDPMARFMYGLKAPESRRQYPQRFKMFLDYLGLQGQLNEQAKQFHQRAKEDLEWVEEVFMDFICFQLDRVKRGEITESTIKNYYKATKLFCEMNDLSSINWKRIRKGLPNGRQASNDRAPTVEEIQKLIEYPDRRIRPIIYTMTSSGIRLGAWDFIKWKHFKPFVDDQGEVMAARLVVYAGDREEYYTFVTPEAYHTLKDWMDFRASYGEDITGESWVMRDIWQTTNVDYGAKWGLATAPKQLKSSGIKRLLERALWEQGIRQPLKSGVRRHEWKSAHGFRKYYKTHAEQVMKPINVEITMGHGIGVSASYYRPSEKEVLNDYLKAVDLLTIGSDRTILKKQVQQLEEKSKDNEYIIRGKILEKEEQIQLLTRKQERFEQLIQSLIDSGQLKPTINAQ